MVTRMRLFYVDTYVAYPVIPELVLGINSY
jgi:hypothetical protein